MAENKKGTWLFNGQTGELSMTQALDYFRPEMDSVTADSLDKIKAEREKEYKEMKMHILQQRKAATEVVLREKEAIKNIHEAINNRWSPMLLGSKTSLKPVAITHAGDSQGIIDIYTQRLADAELYQRGVDVMDELNEMNRTLPEAQLKIAEKEAQDKLKAESEKRQAEWKKAIANLKESILLEEANWYDNPPSDEERVYYAMRVYSISAVLFFAVPDPLKPTKGQFYEPNAAAAYNAAHAAYVTKHGKNPVWNGEELKPLWNKKMSAKGMEALREKSRQDNKED